MTKKYVRARFHPTRAASAVYDDKKGRWYFICISQKLCRQMDAPIL